MKPLVAALCSSLVVLSAGAWAQPDGPRPPPGGPPMKPGLHPMANPSLWEGLGASKETVRKVEQAFFETQERQIALRADLKKARLQLARLMSADKPDEKVVMAQADKIAKISGDVKKNRLALHFKVRELVGPELWEKAKRFGPPHGEFMQPGRGRGEHDGSGGGRSRGGEDDDD